MEGNHALIDSLGFLNPDPNTFNDQSGVIATHIFTRILHSAKIKGQDEWA
jgi:hypothetical protein